MNEVASFYLGIVILILGGLFKLFVWLFKTTKAYLIQYREKKRNSKEEAIDMKNKKITNKQRHLAHYAEPQKHD